MMAGSRQSKVKGEHKQVTVFDLEFVRAVDRLVVRGDEFLLERVEGEKRKG